MILILGWRNRLVHIPDCSAELAWIAAQNGSDLPACFALIGGSWL
jgi:hypothetical protein